MSDQTATTDATAAIAVTAPAQRTDQQIAAALIGTKSLPPNLKRVKELADQAKAYHACNPYPLYAFKNWKTEARGPVPVCMPIAKRITKRGARWLFGKPIQIICAGNTALEKLLRDAWEQNRMGSRAVAMAEAGGQETGVVLKFDYDSARTSGPKLSYQSLSPVYEARLYPHPHRRDRILMARVQYPYQDERGLTWWYREEWTDEEEVHYAPVKDQMYGRSMKQFDPDAYDGWQVTEQVPNRLGVIPMTYIRNIEADDYWGGADMWSLVEGDGLFRVLDRINLARYIQDRNNQYPFEPWLIDAQLDDDDALKESPPGAPVAVETTPDAAAQQKQGRIEFAPTGADQHASITEYIRDLTREIESAASSVNVDQKEFTNKGNLTRAVLEQLYLLQIEITEEKRKSWGTDGLCQFFATVAKGLSNLGVEALGVNAADPDTYTCEIKWPSYFPMSEDEKTAAVGRIQEEEIAGYTTHDRAVEAVAQMEEVQDVEQLKEELAKEPRPSLTAMAGAGPGAPGGAAGSVQQMEQNVNGLKRVGGAASQ